MRWKLDAERVTLAPVCLEDTKFILELISDPDWKKYIGEFGIQTQDQARQYIERAFLNHYRTYGYGLWKLSLRKSPDAIGICGLVRRSWLEGPDLGFALLPAYRREGYCLEACQVAVEGTRDHWKESGLFAITSPGNARSQSLLQKLGFAQLRDQEVPEKPGDWVQVWGLEPGD